MVLGVCRRLLRDHHTAEDAFQATFLVLAMKAATVRKRQSLGAWLHSVATRVGRRAARAGSRRKEMPMPLESVVDPNERDPALAELETVVDEELGKLPEKYRLPIILCYLEGRTQEDVAAVLGWTKGTVSGRLARAKSLLGQRLTRRGIAPAIGLLAASLEPASAKAAVSGQLLNSTVRAATLASFGAARAGLVTAEVARLAHLTIQDLFLARIAKAATLCVFLGIGATAIAQVVGLARPKHGNLVVRDAAGGGVSNIDRRVPRLDRFGDPLPPQILTRLGTIERRHTARVVGVGFSPRDRTAASAQADGVVRFWDTASGRENRRIELTGKTPGDVASIRQIAIDPGGQFLAAVGFVRRGAASMPASSLWIWSLAEDRLWHMVDVASIDVHCVAISPDGQTIATGGNAGEIKLWNSATGELAQAIKLSGGQTVFSLAYSADGKTVATTEQAKGVKLWDAGRGVVTFVEIPTAAGPAPFFSADGRYMAVSTFGGTAVVWDLHANHKHLSVRGAAGGFAPGDSRLAVIRPEQGTLAIIDAETGLERAAPPWVQRRCMRGWRFLLMGRTSFSSVETF